VTDDRFLDRHLFRAFRIAIHFPQVLAASAAVLLLCAGEWTIDRLPFAPDNPSAKWSWQRPLLPQATSPSAGLADRWSRYGMTFFDLLIRPYRSVAEPATSLLSPGHTWTSAAYAWTRLLWALLVWAFFGAMVTRMAAVNFAVQRTVNLTAAMRFASQRILSFFTSPLLPLAGILFFWILLLVGGWIGSIPGVGAILVGLFWMVSLAVGFVVALMVLGVFVSWPLMAPTISTEVSDGFDGFSRPFSYVFSRPWQLLRLLAVSMVYGMVCVGFVVFLAYLTVHVALWGISAGMGVDEVALLTAGSPFQTATDALPTAERPGLLQVGAALTGFWLIVAALLVHGFGVSLFWSLAVIVYFVIRRIDDATALDEVFLTEDEQPDDGLPLPDIDPEKQPISERPLEKDTGETLSPEAASSDAAATAPATSGVAGSSADENSRSEQQSPSAEEPPHDDSGRDSSSHSAL